METWERTVVVVNPRAANGRLGKRWRKLAGRVTSALGDFDLLWTRGPGHATELVRQTLRRGSARVISVGGDGTLNEVVNGFFSGKQPLQDEAVLGVLPMGTGRDFGRTLRIKDVDDALARIERGGVRPIDIGCVTYGLDAGGEAIRYFVNVADFGVGGAVVKRVNETSKFFGGFATFLYAVVRTLAAYKNPVVRLEYDDHAVEGPISNVMVAKGQYYGGGMHLAPEAELDNGRFDVYAIGDVKRWQAVRNLHLLYRGKLASRPDLVSYARTSRVVARSDEVVLLNLDGEQPGRLPATFEILPGALRLITGEGA
jgi:YegS/Rv2252/BmrU family lipid kinase